ncbi:MAG: hypothetical protein WCC10_17085 [Tumebacillaceae bacterium]
MGLEQVRLRAIEQSARGIESTLADVEGVKNRLQNGTPEAQPLAQRLETAQKQIERELQNIRYVVRQGSLPKTSEQLAIGQKVQDAVDEISQI